MASRWGHPAPALAFLAAGRGCSRLHSQLLCSCRPSRRTSAAPSSSSSTPGHRSARPPSCPATAMPGRRHPAQRAGSLSGAPSQHQRACLLPPPPPSFPIAPSRHRRARQLARGETERRGLGERGRAVICGRRRRGGTRRGRSVAVDWKRREERGDWGREELI